MAATDTLSVLLAWFTWPDGTSTEPTKATTNNVHTDDHYGDSVFRAIATRHTPARWSIPSGSEIAATSATSELQVTPLPRRWRDTALVIATVSLPGMKRPSQCFVKQNNW